MKERMMAGAALAAILSLSPALASAQDSAEQTLPVTVNKDAIIYERGSAKLEGDPFQIAIGQMGRMSDLLPHVELSGTWDGSEFRMGELSGVAKAATFKVPFGIIQAPFGDGLSYGRLWIGMLWDEPATSLDLFSVVAGLTINPRYFSLLSTVIHELSDIDGFKLRRHIYGLMLDFGQVSYPGQDTAEGIEALLREKVPQSIWMKRSVGFSSVPYTSSSFGGYFFQEFLATDFYELSARYNVVGLMLLLQEETHYNLAHRPVGLTLFEAGPDSIPFMEDFRFRLNYGALSSAAMDHPIVRSLYGQFLRTNVPALMSIAAANYTRVTALASKYLGFELFGEDIDGRRRLMLGLSPRLWFLRPQAEFGYDLEEEAFAWQRVGLDVVASRAFVLFANLSKEKGGQYARAGVRGDFGYNDRPDVYLSYDSFGRGTSSYYLGLEANWALIEAMMERGMPARYLLKIPFTVTAKASLNFPGAISLGGEANLVYQNKRIEPVLSFFFTFG